MVSKLSLGSVKARLGRSEEGYCGSSTLEGATLISPQGGSGQETSRDLSPQTDSPGDRACGPECSGQAFYHR